MNPTVKGMYRRGSVWWVRFSVNGRQVRQSLETDNESVAVLKAVEILQRAPLEQSEQFKVELDRYLRESIADRRLSKSFAPSRRYVLTAFAQEYGVRDLRDLTSALIQKWIQDMRKDGAKEGTIQSYVFQGRSLPACGSR